MIRGLNLLRSLCNMETSLAKLCSLPLQQRAPEQWWIRVFCTRQSPLRKEARRLKMALRRGSVGGGAKTAMSCCLYVSACGVSILGGNTCKDLTAKSQRLFFNAAIKEILAKATATVELQELQHSRHAAELEVWCDKSTFAIC